jgi:hypothetical protein
MFGSIVLTLTHSASKVNWFPVGCDPYVPHSLLTHQQHGQLAEAYFITLTFYEELGRFALPCLSQTL